MKFFKDVCDKLISTWTLASGYILDIAIAAIYWDLMITAKQLIDNNGYSIIHELTQINKPKVKKRQQENHPTRVNLFQIKRPVTARRVLKILNRYRSY